MNFDNLLKSVEAQTKALGEKLIKGYTTQAWGDLKDFAQESKDDLNRWTQELLEKKLDAESYESLVKGQLDVAEMRALKQAGLAEVQIDSFVNGFLDILVNAAVAAIP